MAMLQGIILEVILIIVLTTIFDLMLPEGKLQPLVRLIMGLFVLASLLNPLLNFGLLQETMLNGWVMKPPDNQAQWESISVQGKELQQVQEQAARQEYEAKLVEQIKHLLIALGMTEISEIQVELSEGGGVVQKISAVCSGSESEAQRCQEFLTGYYGLTENCVQIKRLGG